MGMCMCKRAVSAYCFFEGGECQVHAHGHAKIGAAIGGHVHLWTAVADRDGRRGASSANREL